MRLTTTNKDVSREMICRNEDCGATEEYCPHLLEDECTCLREVIDKLADYEDAEEQGLLIRLPVVAGTVVYQICNNSDACYDCQHYSDFYGMDAMCDNVKVENVSGPRYADKPLCEKQFLEIIEFKADLDFIYRHRNDFGKTVFLTKEEAEAALAEKGGAE